MQKTSLLRLRDGGGTRCFILTLDEDPEADYEGIRRVNALDWLMGRIN